MTSEVTVCNLALGKLGEPRIASLTDDTRTARDCNAIFEHIRRREIRKHLWNFAKKRTTLAPDSGSPDHKFAYQFTLPADWLRTHPGVNDTDWSVEGRKVLTNLTDTLLLVYIADISDVSTWDALFMDVMACALAVELAEPLTQSSAKKQLSMEQYRRAIADARKVNAFERVPDEVPEDSWITARL